MQQSLSGGQSFRLHQSATSPRYGWTLIDLLLVLSVLFVNVSLATPFILSIREGARKVQCLANVKQIGQALNQYHEQYSRLPPGFTFSDNGPYGGLGWSQKILPQLGFTDLSATTDLAATNGMRAFKSRPELLPHLSLLRCPSDPAAPRLQAARVLIGITQDEAVAEQSELWMAELPRSNYFGNAGYRTQSTGGIQYNSAGIPTSLWPLVNSGSLGSKGNPSQSEKRQYCSQQEFFGYFGQNDGVRYSHVVDGTSNTFMIAERYSPLSTDEPSAGHGSWIGVPDCTSAEGLATALGDAAVRINIGMPRREPTTGFGSFHDGGAVFGLGDGSVRFFSESIDLRVYRNLAIIDDARR